MKRDHFFLTFFLLLVTQILICNFLQLSPYVTLTILPVMILMIPVRYGVIFAMVLAFISGLSVDLLSEGILGINSLALVPVALLRRPIIRFIFGDEIFSRKEDISIRKHGVPKMSFAILLAQSLFLVIYIWADSAGMRPFSFNLLRFILSLLPGWLLSLPFSSILAINNHDL